jgi:hypothetical protein
MKVFLILLILMLIFFGFPLFNGNIDPPRNLDATELNQFLSRILAYWWEVWDTAWRQIR